VGRPILEVADIFRDHGPAWREANRGHVSLDQLKVMSAIERCRTAALGGHVERCEDCAHRRISYKSLYGDLYVKLSVGTTRGEPAHWARSKHRAATLYSVGSVLDPDHEAVIRFDGEAPRRRAHSADGIEAMELFGSPPPRLVIDGQSRKCDWAPKLCVCAPRPPNPRSGRRPQHNADRDFAGHDQAPQRDQQFPSECHDHRRLAHALRAFGPRPIPLRQCAVLLEP